VQSLPHYIALLFAGAFLCNCIPHLVAGLQGMPFPTPFARPRGVGSSSPFVNFLWGGLNCAIGLWILSRQPFAVAPNGEVFAFASGVLLLGSYLSRHFGKVRKQGLSTSS
jgi:hypothetical protein